MKILRNLIAGALLLLAYSVCNSYARSEKDRDALQKTSEAIRAAFARGDVPAIMAYHHPDVIKALSFHKYLTGHDAVALTYLRAVLRSDRRQSGSNSVTSELPVS
jgi:hypothetical protein